MEFHHVSILAEKCMEALNIKENGTYIDATTGGAGHSLMIAERLGNNGKLICIDRDSEALQNAEERLKEYSEKVILVKSDFRKLDRVLETQGLKGADGIFFDLGVSSPQLDHAARGFSYTKDAALDMRMDQSQSLTAYEVVNNWSREELQRILFEYGEERYAPLIAAAIERERIKGPVKSTVQLSEIIKSAMPKKALREKQHPAKRSFQAVRIAVNDELGALREAMEKSIDALFPEGRLAVMTFHSLEDRIVKTAFREAARGCVCPKDFPVCVCGKKPKVKLISKKSISPSKEEIEENPRARSARLRVCEKIMDWE